MRCVLGLALALVGCARADAVAFQYERELARMHLPFPWPELEPPPDRQGGGAHDAAVIVALDDATTPGALRNANAWSRWLIESRGVPEGSVALLSGELASAANVRVQLLDSVNRADRGGTLWFLYIGES